MVLGEEVKGLMALGVDWRFVTGDSADIGRRVNELDQNARLVANPRTGEYGVAVWVERSKLGEEDIEADAQVAIQDRGGVWALAFKATDAEGRYITSGEPDQRLIDQMNRASLRRKREDLEKFVEFETRRHEGYVRMWEGAASAHMQALADQMVFGHRKARGIKAARIFVPQGGLN